MTKDRWFNYTHWQRVCMSGTCRAAGEQFGPSGFPTSCGLGRWRGPPSGSSSSYPHLGSGGCASAHGTASRYGSALVWLWLSSASPRTTAPRWWAAGHRIWRTNKSKLGGGEEEEESEEGDKEDECTCVCVYILYDLPLSTRDLWSPLHPLSWGDFPHLNFDLETELEDGLC